ncbi:MAG: OmpA family protein [Alphaproteobacteria bacterium]|nr:OmpA family protein [Alphaproteobacteria bacterium]
MAVASAAMLVAAACATQPSSQGDASLQKPTFYEWRAANPVASPAPQNAPVFSQVLAREYLAFSRFEGGPMNDARSTPIFTRKADSAAKNENPAPETLAAWPLAPQFQQELGAARTRLTTALDAGARTRSAENAALAQFNFDCWLEQQTENFQPAHIAECKNAFMQAMGRVEADMRPVAQPAPPPPAPQVYVVLFPFDSSAISPVAARVLDQAAADYRRLGMTAVRVEGHTDRAGPDAYNQALSERRTKAVIDALVARGVNASGVSGASFGEARPKVPTPDGARNEENRRAEITLSR